MPIADDIMDHDLLGPAIRAGREEGIREMFRLVVEKRFGTLTADFETRLMEMDFTHLDVVCPKAYDSKSLDEVFS